MNKKTIFKGSETYEAIKVMNELLIELEIMEFRARKMIDYHENKMENVNEDFIRLHDYMIFFYKNLIDEIKQQRFDLYPV